MLAEIDELAVRQPRRAELQRGLRALRDDVNRKSAEDEDPRTTPEPVSDGLLRIAAAGILHLSPILQQLVELWYGPPSDDYGCLKPTQHAFDKAIGLLLDAAIVTSLRGGQIPLGCVSTDSEGGVRIEWVRDATSVHLVVPAADSNEAYVYHEIGNNYATEDATPERLSHWLEAIPEGR